MNTKTFDKGIVNVDKIFAILYEESGEVEGLTVRKVFYVKAVSEHGISIVIHKCNSIIECEKYIADFTKLR